LGEEESQQIPLTRRESITSQDLSDALPGDLLQLQDGDHHVDTSYQGARAGGAISNAGAGGERIWKDALLPDEKKAIHHSKIF